MVLWRIQWGIFFKKIQIDWIKIEQTVSKTKKYFFSGPPVIFFFDYNKSFSISQLLKYESLKCIGFDTKLVIKSELQFDLCFDIKNYFNTH